MDVTFFVRRFVVALGISFAVLAAAELLKGHAASAALAYAGIWGAITAGVYTAALAYRLRRGAACNRAGVGTASK